GGDAGQRVGSDGGVGRRDALRGERGGGERRGEGGVGRSVDEHGGVRVRGGDAGGAGGSERRGVCGWGVRRERIYEGGGADGGGVRAGRGEWEDGGAAIPDGRRG